MSRASSNIPLLLSESPRLLPIIPTTYQSSPSVLKGTIVTLIFVLPKRSGCEASYDSDQPFLTWVEFSLERNLASFGRDVSFLIHVKCMRSNSFRFSYCAQRLLR